MTLDLTTLKLESGTSMTVRAGANLDVRGGGIVSVEGGGQLTLGSGSCPTPLRVVDPMFVVVPAGADGAFPVTVPPTGVTDVCIG